MRRMLSAWTLAVMFGTAPPALAVEPVGAPEFNLEASFDLRALDLGNFYATLVPVAQAEGAVVLYDFSESLRDLFVEAIQRFETKYGVRVEHRQVDGEQAVQQLIAARQAGRKAPVDIFFMPNGQVRLANEAGVIGNLPLHTMLPAAQDLDPEAATVSRGYRHGGVVAPFHRNQTAIGYDTRFVSEGSEPKTFDELLAFAKANPGKVAITNPTKGGSGSGFLESAILAMTTPECQTRLYDYAMTSEEAKAWVAGPCLEPVMAWFAELKPLVEFTQGNSDTLTLMANGEAIVGTVWEDMVFDFIGRGLLPPTIRSRLLENGQVGDGDGAMIPAGAQRVAGALLFMDYLMSDEIQLYKLAANGSRTARTTLDIDKALAPEVVARLAPDDQYKRFTRPRIVGVVTSAAADRFVVDILQGS